MGEMDGCNAILPTDPTFVHPSPFRFPQTESVKDRNDRISWKGRVASATD
jgi:hypothetical protein